MKLKTESLTEREEIVLFSKVLREKELGVNTVSLPRENWDTWDPTLISEV